jgi:hypothetical protein
VQELNFSLADLFEHKNQMFGSHLIAVAAAATDKAEDGSSFGIRLSGRGRAVCFNLYKF